MTNLEARKAFFENRPVVKDGHVYDYVIRLKFRKAENHAGVWDLGWHNIPEHIKKHTHILRHSVTLLDELSETQHCELTSVPEQIEAYDNTPFVLTDAEVNSKWHGLFTGKAARIRQAFYNHLPVTYNGERYEYISAFEVVKDFGSEPRHKWDGTVTFAVNLAGLNSAPIPIEKIEIIYPKREVRAV